MKKTDNIFYVARNKNGLLRCASFKPYKINEFMDAWSWLGTKAQVMNLPKEMFPNVKWDDKEPLEVKIVPLKDAEEFNFDKNNN